MLLVARASCPFTKYSLPWFWPAPDIFNYIIAPFMLNGVCSSKFLIRFYPCFDFRSELAYGQTICCQQPRSLSDVLTQKVNKFIYRKSCFSDYRSQCSFSYFFVIGNSNAAIWRANLPKNYMASALTIYKITCFAEGFNYCFSGNHRQRAQIETSTISSVIEGGTGSPCASKLSR